MPTRQQTIADAVRLFDQAEYPSGLSRFNAWLGIYQTLLWYEKIDWIGYDFLPHIIDADKLRPSTSAKKKTWIKPTQWQLRANAVSTYLAGVLGCALTELPLKFNRLMRLPEYEEMQPHNSRGIAFAGLVRHVLQKFGQPNLQYGVEVDAGEIFPGISVPGRSGTPRIDLLVRRDELPQAIISTKWSVRHDRLNDITNECPVYKAAYARIYRQAGRREIPYYVVTNEFDSSRLTKMLEDTCVEGVVHVHKHAVIDVCGLNGRLTQLIDLADFIELSHTW
jgi:hypothetical protein